MLSVYLTNSTYLFYRFLHHIPYDGDSPSLAQAVSSTDCLCFNGRVPLWFDEVDPSCCCEVEPGARSANGTSNKTETTTYPTAPVPVVINSKLVSLSS